MRHAIAVLALCGASAAAEAPAPPLWIAVGRPGLVEAVEPLAARRKAEGFEVVVSAKPVAEALADIPDFEVPPAFLRGNKPFQLRRAAFLLLVGDDEPGKEAEPWSLPAKRRDLYRWRAEQAQSYAADPLWGDLDGDLVPELPVGRLPARTRAEADLVVKKILDYEGAAVAESDLRLAVWAGSPRYGAAVDVTAALTLLTAIQSGVPGWLQPWVLASDTRFPFCGWPAAQPARFARELRQGAILASMMGHADAGRFWSMAHDGREVVFGAAEAKAAFAEGAPVSPVVILACHAGDFTRPAPCLAETLLALPGGPVAAVAATTESHPLTNYFTGMALLEAVGGKDRRLGTIWLRAQRAAHRARNPLAETVLRNVEGKLEAELDIPRLKRDQLLMYALLGDPGTRLRYPLPMEVKTEKTIEGWKWKAVRPEGAESLQVGLRPVSPRLPVAKGLTDEATAQAQLDEANGALAYVALPAPVAGAPWEGVTPKGGWLRLVAAGGGKTWVASVKLEGAVIRGKARVMNRFRVASAAILGLLVAACSSTDKPAAPAGKPADVPAAKAAVPAPAPAAVVAPSAVPAPADGLVAHWTLDDLSVADATGRGHTGVVKGKVERVDGRIGGALQFPGGGDDHVEIPNAPDLENLQEGSYTVAAWFKPADLPPGADAANNANYAIVLKSGWHEGLKYTNEGKLGLDHWLTEDAWCGIGTWDTSYDPKQWRHVVGVVDRKGGQTRIYVDGALQNTGDLDGAEPAREYGQTTWKIGIGNPGAAEWRWPAKGAIDDVRLYNRALTDAEVGKLYQAAK